MTTTPVYREIAAENVSQSLQQVCQGLGEADVCLDFAGVRRVGPDALKVMEELAGIATQKAVKVSLRGVNIDIYRVLKLARLTSRFEFLG